MGRDQMAEQIVFRFSDLKRCYDYRHLRPSDFGKMLESASYSCGNAEGALFGFRIGLYMAYLNESNDEFAYPRERV